MGWLFGWHTRKDLVDHLITGNGVKTIEHCFKGNNLWAVNEYTKQDGSTVQYIALYLLRGRTGSRDGWGYKDMDESCGPNYYNCPLKYLDMVKNYEPVGYAKEWREQVREYWTKRNRKLGPGTRIKVSGKEWEVVGRPYRNKRDYAVKDIENGGVYRMKEKYLVDVEVLT
jgi:hypothetical protein